MDILEEEVPEKYFLSEKLQRELSGKLPDWAKTGIYFVDLCIASPKITKIARCLQARYFKRTGRPREASGVIIDGRIRRLTPRECFRLQGFLDELFDRAQAVNSDSQLYKQAGNSVTVPVIRAIAEKIRESEILK